MKHPIKLHIQKAAVLRAFNICEETYPARILQKKTTQEKADKHLECLEAAMRTLDGLDEGIDQREDK